MSKVKSEVVSPTESVSSAPVSTTPVVERLSDLDKMALELAKSKRQTALAEAKTALAQNENAEISYKYLVLQIYMKYGLGQTDAINEDGSIIRGGAASQQQ